MKKLTGLNLLLFLSISFCFCLEKNIDDISISIGQIIKKEIDNSCVKINIDKVIEGIKNTPSDKNSYLTEDELSNLISNIIEQQKDELSKKNLLVSEKFFKKNKKKNSVKQVINEKVQYKILNKGKGEKVERYHSPHINLKGYLLDGTVFSPSEDCVATLDDLPQALKLSIIGMKEKEKRQVFIHPKYFDKANKSIPSNSIVIFDVEIIKTDKIKLNSINQDLAQKIVLR
jgi:FKBP-type peptidyl-prolyl cis-trans isomerase